MATINFSLARVWLLFQGGSYSRVALIIFGTHDRRTMHCDVENPMAGEKPTGLVSATDTI